MDAQVIWEHEGEARTYDAFELADVTEDGALLSGPILLERGESAQLQVVVDGKAVKVRAHVKEIVDGQMRIAFDDAKAASALIG